MICIPPACAVVPITRVPAVIAARSVAATENVEPVLKTDIALAPLGIKLTVPEPAFSVPEKAISLAVILIG